MNYADGLAFTADECFVDTINDCLKEGARIESPKDTSLDLLDYSTGFLRPRARIITNPLRPLNIVVAVARFTWMIAGNNRVHDIAYYEPKVAGFTDNGLTVPGSCYGNRLFEPRPGLNQLVGVVDRLVRDPHTRRASAVVWAPEDAVRQSNDIPCTFGVFFHVREERLVMQTIMRSNNAYRILPFNLFEFSMLQELVASQIGREPGPYLHHAGSMHVYDNDSEMPNTLAVSESRPGDSLEMLPMPKVNPMTMANLLARYEADIRHSCNRAEFDAVVMKAGALLDPYWLTLFAVLANFTAAKRDYGLLDIPMDSSIYNLTVEAIDKMLSA